MPPSFKQYARTRIGLCCAAAVMTAGCHNNNNISDYGLAWTTVTAEPGGTSNVPATPADFSSYIVTIDSITFTRNDGIVATGLATPEIVDFSKQTDISELWGTATIPNGTYLSATITLDYTPTTTSGIISVLVNGVPTPATISDVTGATGTSVTTKSVNVTFDPAHPLIVTPTYASTSAQRFSINFDLAASGWVAPTAGAPTVVVNPYFTAGILPPDNKLIRIRGPLINTNVDIGTYTTYIRPFHDETSALGTLSLFNTPSTIYSINGVPYVGSVGVNTLSQLSAGTTTTASYATFTPDFNTLNQAAAGTFYPVYVVAGSTLEDIYTEGLSGEVIARNGNTVTLRGSTLFLNTADEFFYETGDSQLLLGPGTTVTADNSTLTGLTSDSIAVGQHIEARGIYSQLSATEVQLDATGTSSTNTGSVRLLPTQLYGPLVSAGTGSVAMNVQAIDGYPASVFNFSGNGATAAQNPLAASFAVNTGSLALPAGTAAGDLLYVNGLFAPFGTAPPDFTASAVNSEATVQVAGGSGTAAGTQACGLGSQVCQPASLRVLYNYGVGTTTPFVGLSDSGFSIDLANPELVSAVIRIGPENIDLTTLPASPQIVPTTLAATATFSPLYSVGNPRTATITTTATTASSSLMAYSSFPSFVTEYNSLVSASNTVLQISARGVYNRSSNLFTATSINVVL